MCLRRVRRECGLSMIRDNTLTLINKEMRRNIRIAMLRFNPKWFFLLKETQKGWKG